ncbi:MAG TPA: 2,3-bisphosphoglycerate-independent phosphoglycerate mutase, partial [Flavobacteriaceae bacterium]|nr:2,3-bisphosphoglycerate-independent phosphoglycerate mutase [Flavobacteriaceae bacterium]
MNKKTILLILDGWGCTTDASVSAIAQANTPYIDKLLTEYPNTTLRTDGRNVGLPDGQMGNSEVGHMNLGAGRIVYQDLAKINIAVENGDIGKEKVLMDAMQYAKENDKNLHLIGLLSDGGVHSHIGHLEGLLKVAKEQNIEKVFVHAFTDGRDVDPKSSIGYINRLTEVMQKTTGKLASIIGRYYAMDRDRRWERVAKAYHLLINGLGTSASDPIQAIKDSYDAGFTDEFIQPIVLTENDQPIATIEKDDVVVFFNFRTDRGR